MSDVTLFSDACTTRLKNMKKMLGRLVVAPSLAGDPVTLVWLGL